MPDVWKDPATLRSIRDLGKGGNVSLSVRGEDGKDEVVLSAEDLKRASDNADAILKGGRRRAAPPPAGHNSGAASTPSADDLPLSGGDSFTKAPTIAADRLKSFIERIERLEEEKKAIAGDIRDVFSEAKGAGFDVRTMREVIRLRRIDAAERDERETMLDLYKQALGML